MENDELFFEQLAIGHKWTEYVAARLNAAGVPCYATKMEKRKNIADRSRFQNERDIVLTATDGWLEVKSQGNQPFSEDPSEYPKQSAFVDTLSGWRRKNPRPLAVILVHQQTRAMLVIPVSTESEWGTYTGFDRIRKIQDTWLTVQKKHLRRFSDLVDWLKARQISRPTSAQASAGSA